MKYVCILLDTVHVKLLQIIQKSIVKILQYSEKIWRKIQGAKVFSLTYSKHYLLRSPKSYWLKFHRNTEMVWKLNFLSNRTIKLGFKHCGLVWRRWKAFLDWQVCRLVIVIYEASYVAKLRSQTSLQILQTKVTMRHRDECW